MNAADPVRTDIVLLGGGHAHVHVLAAFAAQPVPGMRLTLVSRDLDTPYSGMLPGVIAGLYERDQAHIDLVRLAAATGARLIHADAIGLDRAAKRVLLAGRPPMAYDLVSIDVGITPALDAIKGAREFGVAVKPIGSFLAKLDAIRASVREADGPRHVAVVGGGAGGVELLLSMRTRLLQDARAAGRDASAFSFSLVTDRGILAGHNTRVQETFRRILRERGVTLFERSRVQELRAGEIVVAGGDRVRADIVLLATQAAAPAWFRQTGLSLNADGFISVGPTLQAHNDPDVFAAGDCADLSETPREKAGVYAVRAGPPLARNLRRRAQGDALKPWRPQRRHLALISAGERYAVASRGWFKAEGAWLWTVKDFIDRRFMRMYQDTDAMIARMRRRAAPAPDRDAVEEMRCGGCAAKIGPGPLSRALARLPRQPASPDIIVGLDAPDDAAVIIPPAGKPIVQTIDFFRAFIDDPYLFGEIAANHALNDIFAMGGEPHHALANAVVPAGPAAKVEEALFQLLAGARACLDRENVVLAGGHSSEGMELALGFSVTGSVAAERVIRKAGLTDGQALILTRPVGTGIVFAAMMRAKARAGAIEEALAQMRRSNRRTATILVAHGATAMTDVTGFGLVGHLGEMLAASGVQAELDLDAVPLYRDALNLARQGIASTLLPENLTLARLLRAPLDDATRAVLFDPQTSGGLLAGMPRQHADECIAALHAAGDDRASIIGRVSGAGLQAGQVGIDTTGLLAT